MPSAPETRSISPLDVVRLLRSAGAALFTQASLHGQLARVEWEEEKARLLGMAIAALLCFAGLLCLLLMAGAVVLAFSWNTPYRVPAALALVAAYGLIAGFAWRRIRLLSARSSQAFAATREELAADLALLKEKL
ncbi:MAG: phage holin family protein [Steroidobacteraceae bacterium]